MDKICISSMRFEKLCEFTTELGQPKFRAKQIYIWLHNKHVDSFSEMTNLPKVFINVLEEKCVIERVAIEKKQVSSDGTIKYLFKLQDENCIETVVMRYNYGNTVCVSTQVGCRMGCRFCASTKGGLVRNLTAGEIAAQIYAAKKDIGERISNIVLMGIGEPLDNYDYTIDFLRIISSDDGENIGMRNISVSTCGLVNKIDELSKLKLGITLSVSLHAPFNEMRSEMMPINNTYPISDLISACKNYANSTGRRISFEYSLVKGVNDSEHCAIELAKLLKSMGAHVNLIPINPIDGSPYSASDEKNIRRFKQKLQDLSINATVRRRLGTDISAACGQLRHETKGGQVT